LCGEELQEADCGFDGDEGRLEDVLGGRGSHLADFVVVVIEEVVEGEEEGERLGGVGGGGGEEGSEGRGGCEASVECLRRLVAVFTCGDD
jgi:hypothetical protein